MQMALLHIYICSRQLYGQKSICTSVVVSLGGKTGIEHQFSENFETRLRVGVSFGVY